MSHPFDVLHHDNRIVHLKTDSQHNGEYSGVLMLKLNK
ncbi:MAG: hypothetical protein GPOALKHO_000191 [Sodalis sp.]|nr:MAG: hypothetical protein GPOALKHO_000191 [Sodalis sp.]